MQGGREKGGRGGGVCPSVEALDCKSGILGVPDFNLEEKQTEKRDGVSEERRDSIMSGKRRRGDKGTAQQERVGTQSHPQLFTLPSA